MKRALSILMAIIMVCTLFACSGKQSSPTPTPSDTAATTASASATPSPSQNTDVTANENEVGFFSDGVDPASRKTYNIVFAYPRPMQLMQNITNVLEKFQKKLNFKLATTTGDNDIDLYIQNLEVFANQGTDGFICVIDPNSSSRIVEVLKDLGVPYIGLLNTVRDSSGGAIVPCVALDGYTAGETQMQWLYDNYKKYWGDIDTSQIGFLDITFSANKDFQDRYEGALAKYKELFPNNTKIFTADGVTGKMDAETGYNMSTAIFSANPDVKYWLVVSCLEMYAQGAAKASESMNIKDKTLVSCVGSDILSSQWDIGYEGSWVTCLAVSDYLYTAPTICGLIAMLDGKATEDSLWPTRKGPNDKAAIYYISNQMVTKDTYKAYFAKIDEILDLGD